MVPWWIMPAVAVGQVRFIIDSTYYRSERDYLYALADVLREEYEAIVNAGFVLQVDSPDVPMMRNRQLWDVSWEAYRRHLALRIEALNHALAPIPEERIRFHVYWGNTYGPHHRDVPLKEIVDLVLQVKAQAYSIEAANPRHAHEWEIWQDVQLPDGKILIPGVIDSVSLFIETPELVCQRLVPYAERVGRENVIAAPDCGFGTFSAWAPRVHSEPLWEKFRAMVRGAELATKKLWGKSDVQTAQEAVDNSVRSAERLQAIRKQARCWQSRQKQAHAVRASRWKVMAARLT
jgi:5-methyltetrahydropteroyltriglutamate--homocysteine methyltransferase